MDLREWLPRLDWVIQGGESGRQALPFDLAWADDLIGQCHGVHIPLFIKQLGSMVVAQGEHIALRDGHGGHWSEWPVRLRVRRMPKLG